MSISNPFWKTYNAFWLMLEGESDFTTAVPASSRIKYTDTTDRNPDPKSASTADFPLVRVRPLGAKPHAHNTTNSSMVELRWSIEVYSGDQRLCDDVQKIFDVWWAIYKALTKWQTYFTFTHDADGFIVTYCKAAEVTDEITDENFHRKQAGWQSVWIGDTDVWFQTSSL